MPFLFGNSSAAQLGGGNIWGLISRLLCGVFLLDLRHSESYDYNRVPALIREKKVSASHDCAGGCIVVAVKEMHIRREREKRQAKRQNEAESVI